MVLLECSGQRYRDGTASGLEHIAADGTCDGRGQGLIIDEDELIAIMVEDCGFPTVTGVPRGAIVRFSEHTEAQPKIVGEPAFIVPIYVPVDMRGVPVLSMTNKTFGAE